VRVRVKIKKTVPCAPTYKTPYTDEKIMNELLKTNP
jgi:hypothetical protein